MTTLTGKRGTLTIRDRNEWVGLARDGNGDGEDDSIAFSTWKVVRGTGQYAGSSARDGVVMQASVALGMRYEGILTSP